MFALGIGRVAEKAPHASLSEQASAAASDINPEKMPPKMVGAPRPPTDSKDSKSSMKHAALALIEDVLGKTTPVDLRALLRMCLQHLDEEAAAARRIADRERRAAEEAAKAAAKASKELERTEQKRQQEEFNEKKEAERRAAAAAKEEAARLKAEAEAKRKAEERAVKEAAAAAKAAAEAQRKAEEAEEKARTDAEAKDAAEARAAEETRRKAELATAGAEAKVEAEAMAAQRRADEAAKREAERLEKAERAREQVEEKRWRAEEKALLEAERQADKARQKAGEALDEALAAAAQVDKLADSGGESGDVGSSHQLQQPQGATQPVDGRRSSSRMSALRRNAWSKLGGAESNDSNDSDDGEDDEKGGGGAFTITYGNERTFGRGSAALQAMEEEGEEAAAASEATRKAEKAAAEAARRNEDVARLPGWLKPWQQFGGERYAEMDGTMTVQSDCIAAEGKDCLVCIGGDGDAQSVSIYSVKLGHVVKSLHGHTDKVISVAMQADLIASGSKDKTIRLWSRRTGQRITTLIGCGDTVHGLALRGDLLLSGEGGKPEAGGARARLWSIGTGKMLTVFSEHRGAVWSVALSDGLGLSASHDATARVWATDGSEKSLACFKHPNWVCSISVEETLAATGCADTRVRLWSLSSFTCVCILEHGGGGTTGVAPIFSVRMMRGGQVLLSGGQDQKVKLWAIHERGGESSQIEATTSATAEIKVELEAECVATFDHGENVRGIAVMPNLTCIATAGGRSCSGVILWTPASPASDDNKSASENKRRTSLFGIKLT